VGRKFTSAEVEVTAKDKTGEGLKSVGTRVGALTKLVKTYWAEIATAYLVMKKVVAVLNDWTKESRAQEQAVMKLNTVMKSMGTYSFEASKEMLDFADSMQRVTTFSDEVIINGQALMSTFRSIGRDIFPDAMEAAMDMSVVFGQDLQSSVVQLGKALNDPITGLTALRRVGVSFSEQQKEQIKYYQETNQLAKAQAIILNELNSEFGNAAKAMGQTAGGQAVILKNKISELKEELGFMIDSEMPAFLELANRIAETLMKWVGAINANKKALKEWRDQVADMNKAELTEAIKQQDAVVQSLANQLKPIQDVIEKNKWLTKEYREANKAYKELIPQYDDSIKKLYDLNEALKNYDKSHRAAKKTTEEIAPVMVVAKKATEDYIKTWDEWQKARFGERSPAQEGGFGEMFDEEAITNAQDYAAAFSSAMGPVVEETTALQKAFGELLITQEEMAVFTATTFRDSMISGFDAIMTGTKSLKEGLKDMIASFLVGLGRMFFTQFLAYLLFRPGKAAKALAASVAAYAGAAVVRSLAKGGEFVTQGPELIQVGDNPSGRERVSVTPEGSPGFNQSGAMGGDVYFDGDKVGRWIAKQVRAKNIPIYKGALVSS
jgi:hypothetical protein